MAGPAGDLMSVREAARYACVSETVVRGWVAARKLPHFRLGLGRGKIMIAPADLEALLASFKVGARAEAPEPPPRPRLAPAAVKHLPLD